MKIAIYTRVSTVDKQDLYTQLIPLEEYVQRRGWDVYKIYADKMSGSKESRPSLDLLMQEAHKRKFDCVLVFRFDRFARSLKQLVLALDTFKSLNIDFISYQESVDTSTSGGLLMFNLIASFAQFERSIIQERVRAGIAKARAKGKVLGRPKKDVDIDKIKQLRKKGFSIRKIAKEIGVPKTTVSKFC